MPVLTSQTANFTPSSGLHVEAGQGKMEITFTDTDSNDVPIVIDLDRVEYPFYTPDNATINCLGESFIAYAVSGGTSTGFAQVANVYSDDSDINGNVAHIIQYGTGAAILEDDIGGTRIRMYVKLDKLSYPLHFQQRTGHTVSITPIGENSVIGTE